MEESEATIVNGTTITSTVQIENELPNDIKSNCQNSLVRKRSSRRLNKDPNDSVLQTAIARKEKYYNEIAQQPQRSSKRLKSKDDIKNINKPKKIVTKDKVKENGFGTNDNDSEKNDDEVKLVEVEAQNQFAEVFSSESSPKCKSDDDKAVTRRRSTRQSTSTESSSCSARSKVSLDQSIFCENVVFRKCLCEQKTNLYFKSDSKGVMFCSAIDSIEKKSIGCSRTTNQTYLVRASHSVPYSNLCSSHMQRFLQHNSCPGCGAFCTQGDFIYCKNNHQYHASCRTTRLAQQCLHCGESDAQTNVKILINYSSNIEPIYLSFQRQTSKPSRLSLTKSFASNEQFIIGHALCQQLRDIDVDLNDNNQLDCCETIDDLYDACALGSLERVKRILNASDLDISQALESHENETPLHVACKNGHVLIAHLLISHGANKNALDAHQETPLVKAINQNDAQMVKYLLYAGVDAFFKCADGMTAVHFAAKNGNVNAVKDILSCADNLSAIDQIDEGGWSPLVWACEHNNVDIVTYLLSRGADANLRDFNQNTPLHWATVSGNANIFLVLTSPPYNCDVNVMNAQRDTPLHIAARLDDCDLVMMLITRGAKLDIRNTHNESPLDCCQRADGASECSTLISLNLLLQNSARHLKTNTLVLNDLSNGKEFCPVQCINEIDSEAAPNDFTYITSNCVTCEYVKIDTRITQLLACECKNVCVGRECACSALSAGLYADEKLHAKFNFADPPMIFECNATCSCNVLLCNNRVIQRGLTQRLHVFRTRTKGWGVKTLKFIARGSYVCEYVGELITDNEADKRHDDSYLFDLDSREGESYCIDACRYGNVSRFINHCCEPNLTPVRFFVDHHDLRFPRIAFFANRDIGADEELSFDYGDKFWAIKCKLFLCSCGVKACKYSHDYLIN